jgi:hypothetical protein
MTLSEIYKQYKSEVSIARSRLEERVDLYLKESLSENTCISDASSIIEEYINEFEDGMNVLSTEMLDKGLDGERIQFEIIWNMNKCGRNSIELPSILEDLGFEWMSSRTMEDFTSRCDEKLIYFDLYKYDN